MHGFGKFALYGVPWIYSTPETMPAETLNPKPLAGGSKDPTELELRQSNQRLFFKFRV